MRNLFDVFGDEKINSLLKKLILLFSISGTALLTGCSLTVPLVVFSGNGDEVLKGTATGYLDGSGKIQFSGTTIDVQCQGDFQYQRTGYKGWGTGSVECTDGTTANFKFDSATSSKGSGYGDDSKGRFFFFAYGYKDSVARILFEKAAGHRIQKKGPELIPPKITLKRSFSIEETNKTQDVISRVSPHTVRIQTEKNEGTGFFIDGKELILTNSHVVGLAETVQINYQDNSSTTASVIGRAKDIDIALLKAYQPKDLSNPIAFCYGGYPEVGEDVIAIGNPIGLGTTITKGIVSGLRGSGITKQIQTDTSVNPGNSGGPLINYRGEIIGVVTSKIGGIGIENIAFAIPTEQAIDSLGIDVESTNAEQNLTKCGNQILEDKSSKNAFQNFLSFSDENQVSNKTLENSNSKNNSGFLENESFYKLLSFVLGICLVLTFMTSRFKK